MKKENKILKTTNGVVDFSYEAISSVLSLGNTALLSVLVPQEVLEQIKKERPSYAEVIEERLATATEEGLVYSLDDYRTQKEADEVKNTFVKPALASREK